MKILLILTGLTFSVTFAGPPAEAGIHSVARGESLTSISRIYAVSVAELVVANNISNPNRVFAGRKLVIPDPVPSFVPASRANLRSNFIRYARQAGIKPSLAMAVAWQESGWQTNVVSRTNAVGVMQLMPKTVDFVSATLLRGPKLDPTRPGHNIRMGSHFLVYLLRQNGGNRELALASYFQGLASVKRNGPTPAAQRFAGNVIALQPKFS